MDIDETILKPQDTEFALSLDEDDELTLWLLDKAHQNDDIRGVDYLTFDKHWGNTMENVFTANNKHMTMEGAMKWCLSIGMTHNPDLAGNVGG